jgi:hypothetical protein
MFAVLKNGPVKSVDLNEMCIYVMYQMCVQYAVFF